MNIWDFVNNKGKPSKDFKQGVTKLNYKDYFDFIIGYRGRPELLHRFLLMKNSKISPTVQVSGDTKPYATYIK